MQFRDLIRRFARAPRVTSDVLRQRSLQKRDVVTTFFRWLFLRGTFNRGYVLLSGLYFVTGAHLSASQNVLLGTVMSVTLVLSDIPTGVWADAHGRKWPLVIGHLSLGASMVMTGLVTTFPLLVVTGATLSFAPAHQARKGIHHPGASTLVGNAQARETPAIEQGRDHPAVEFSPFFVDISRT